jgi:hypothetical protein
MAPGPQKQSDVKTVPFKFVLLPHTHDHLSNAGSNSQPCCHLRLSPSSDLTVACGSTYFTWYVLGITFFQASRYEKLGKIEDRSEFRQLESLKRASIAYSECRCQQERVVLDLILRELARALQLGKQNQITCIMFCWPMLSVAGTLSYLPVVDSRPFVMTKLPQYSSMSIRIKSLQLMILPLISGL